jgi:Tol biopolymer transport system component
MLGISLITACNAPKITPAAGNLPMSSSTITFTPSLAWTVTPTASSTPVPTAIASLTPTASVTFTATPTLAPTAFGGFRNDRLVAWITNGQVVVSRVDDSEPVFLNTTVLHNKYPGLVGWTQDGQWLLFSEACIGGCKSPLWAARPDGTEVKLVSSDLSDYRNFSWHPDGTRFIFECGPGHPSQGDDVPDHKICQGWIKDFTITPGSLVGINPQYSPDGKQVAVVQISYSTNKASLYVANDQLNQPTLVTIYDSWMAEFAWLADSQRIVYVQRSSSFSCGIFMTRVAASDPLPLIKLDNCFPGFRFLDRPSPDGRFVVYYYQSRAYILDLDNPQEPALARAPIGARLVWSPDGKLIALTPGSPAMLIDPKTGQSSEIGIENPWLSISRWLPSTSPAVYFYDTLLQP